MQQKGTNMQDAIIHYLHTVYFIPTKRNMISIEMKTL